MNSTLVLLIVACFLINLSNGLYIKTSNENQSNKNQNNDKNNDEWSVFKQKLGLTNQKGNYSYLNNRRIANI